MRPFVENFPFFSIFLAMLAGIVTATIRSGRTAYWITMAVCAAAAVLNACVLEYTYLGDLSFTYTMGRFLAPYGNAIKCGPLQALLTTVFSLVMAAAWRGAGGTCSRTSCRRSSGSISSWWTCCRRRCWR